MQVTDFPDSSLDRLHRQQQLQLQQQSPRMVGPGDQISVCSIGSQTDNATPSESSSHGAEASNQFIRKRIIHDVVSQVPTSSFSSYFHSRIMQHAITRIEIWKLYYMTKFEFSSLILISNGLSIWCISLMGTIDRLTFLCCSWIKMEIWILKPKTFF